MDEVWEKWKKVLSFFLSYNKCFISDLFFLFLLFFFKSFSTSPVCLQGTMKKALFLHLFDKTLSMEKEIFVFAKRSGKRFQFWIQKLCEPWTVKHCNLYEWDYLCLNYVKLAEVMQEANVSKIPWPIVIKMLQMLNCYCQMLNLYLTSGLLPLLSADHLDHLIS